METATRSERVRFGAFEFDTRTRELYKYELKLKLQGQPVEVLALLLGRPGELVTREEIQKKLWPADTFVDFERGLNSAINRLREALSDSAESPRYIETLPRRGYRFIGAITPNGSSFSVPENKADESPRTRTTQHRIIGFAAVAVAGLLVAGFLWLRSPLPPPRVLRYTQLTMDGKEKNRPCFDNFSRLVTDGTRVYFSEPNSPLMQVSARGGDVAHISTPFGCFSTLAMSPDKTELIVTGTFLRNEPLWLLSLVSGQSRRVGDLSGHKAAWSPDGQSIVYATGRTLDQAANEVYVAKKDGRESRRLARIEHGVISSLTWSPDGRVIRMGIWQEDSVHIWEMFSDGSNLHRLAITPEGNRLTPNGSWTPDQKYFVFGADTDSDRRAIWVLRERHSFFRRGSPKPVQLTSGAMDFWQPALSPDGKRIFAIGGLTRGQLLRYDLKLQRFEPYLSGISAAHLDFSRDGKWVTYVTFPEAILWRSRVDGSERMQLTNLPLRAYVPRWSPDGTQIAFAGELPGEYLKIYLVSAEGGHPQLVSQGDEHQADPTWAADGHSVIFGPSFFSARPRLYSVDLRSGRVSVIPGSEGMYRPHVSPDGRFIVAVETPGNHKMFLFDLQTQRWSELAKLSLLSPTPIRWSPDSKYLYFVINSVPEQPLYRVRIPDGKVDHLAVLDVPGGITGIWEIGVSLAPDGSPVVLRDASIQEIYALDVDLP